MKKTLLVILSLFVLSGCETMEWTSVSVGTGHHYPHGHISYTLGFYSGSHYNGYSVHGSHGYRYYYAPRNYGHHHYYPNHHYVRPVVVHQHVHVASCYTHGGHRYNPPRPRHNAQPRQNQHTLVPNRTPTRVVRQRERQPDRVVRQRERQPDRVVRQRERQPDRVAPQRNNRVERNDRREDRAERRSPRDRERQHKK